MDSHGYMQTDIMSVIGAHHMKNEKLLVARSQSYSAYTYANAQACLSFEVVVAECRSETVTIIFLTRLAAAARLALRCVQLPIASRSSPQRRQDFHHRTQNRPHLRNSERQHPTALDFCDALAPT